MSWLQKWKTGKVPEKGTERNRTMSPTETIVNLRKSPELLDRRHPGHAEAQAKLTAAYREIYGDQVEEDNSQ